MIMKLIPIKVFFTSETGTMLEYLKSFESAPRAANIKKFIL
jgi:pyruvoyl-dependent arginine decarboxylase (PvlArgDC)